MPDTPTLTLPRRGGEETPAQSIPSQDASTGAEGLAVGWEPKPVAVLAIEVTWPEHDRRPRPSAMSPGPWPAAGSSAWPRRWRGSGASSSRARRPCAWWPLACPRPWSNCRSAPCRRRWRSVTWPLRCRPQQDELAGPVVRLAGHLGTLLVAEETDEPSWALARGGGDAGPTGAAARACGAGGGAGVRAHRTADRGLGGNAGAPAAVRERTRLRSCSRIMWGDSCHSAPSRQE